MIRNFSKIRSLRQFTVDSQEVQIEIKFANSQFMGRIDKNLIAQGFLFISDF